MILILDDLLMLPLKGGLALVKKIRDMAEDELYDPERIKNLLAELNEAYETGEIEKEEFQKLEAKLLKRLEIGTERKKGGG
jgi:hypothetical protein